MCTHLLRCGAVAPHLSRAVTVVCASRVIPCTVTAPSAAIVSTWPIDRLYDVCFVNVSALALVGTDSSFRCCGEKDRLEQNSECYGRYKFARFMNKIFHDYFSITMIPVGFLIFPSKPFFSVIK